MPKILLRLKAPIEIDTDDYNDEIGETLANNEVAGLATKAEIHDAVREMLDLDPEFALNQLSGESFDIEVPDDVQIEGIIEEKIEIEPSK